MRTILTTLLLCLCGAVMAQDAGRLYEEGKELYDAKKYTQAIPKLHAAAELGHKKAQYRLGRCYDKGHGIKEDDKQAVHWYRKSADQGFAKAQYELGKCYKNGEGIGKNRTMAVKYFQLAAAQDNAEAQLALGKCYMKGKGVAEDQAKAKELFGKAVNDKKDGADILKELRAEAAKGDDDARKILQLVK